MQTAGALELFHRRRIAECEGDRRRVNVEGVKEGAGLLDLLCLQLQPIEGVGPGQETECLFSTFEESQRRGGALLLGFRPTARRTEETEMREVRRRGIHCDLPGDRRVILATPTISS